MSLTGFLVTAILVFTGLVFLQVFFSEKDNKWAGFILPIITFCFAFLIVLTVAFDNYYGLSLPAIAFIFFFPTAILLTIHVAYRVKSD